MKAFKRLIAVVMISGLCLGLAACGSTGGGNEADTGAAAETKDITVCLDWTPNTNHTGLYVALANGYYEEAGLNVTIVQPPENGATEACAAGQAQFAIDAQDTLAPAFCSDTPLAVTAVAALIAHNTSGIISLKGQGMDSPKGLEDHTYLTWDSPVELAMMENVVTADGGDWSKVTLNPNAVTDEAQDVKTNPDHAIWVFAGWGQINAEVNDIDTDFFFFSDINPVFDYYTPILIANNDYLKNEPDAAKAFLAATEKGYVFAKENPAEAAQILIDGDNTKSLVGSEELVNASQEYLSENYYDEASGWGYIDPDRWNSFYAWLFEEGLITKELPAGTGFTNDYLPGK